MTKRRRVWAGFPVLMTLLAACSSTLVGGEDDSAVPTEAGVRDTAVDARDSPVEVGQADIDEAEAGSADTGGSTDAATPDAGGPGGILRDLEVSATGHDLATDAAGTVHILWRQGGLFHGRIEAGAITGRSGIPGSARINSRFSRPRLAVRPDGSSVHTAFTNAGAGVTLTHAVSEGGAWRTETIWEQGSTSDFIAVPAIAVDAGGGVHVIAQRWREGVRESPIVYFRKPAGGAWQPPVAIHVEAGQQWRDTDMIADAAGGIHATWKTARRPGKYRWVSSGGDLATETTMDIALAGITTVSFGDLFVTAAGDVHHAFLTYPAQEMWHVVRRAGGPSFAEASRIGTIDNDETRGYENPWSSLVVDAAERVWVTWAENRGADRITHVMVARSGPGGWLTWTADANADTQREGRPVLAVSGREVHLVWRADGGALRLETFSVP